MKNFQTSLLSRRRRTIIPSVAVSKPAFVIGLATYMDHFNAPSIGTLRGWFIKHTGPTVRLSDIHNGDVTITSQAMADDLVGVMVNGRVMIDEEDIEISDFGVQWNGVGTGANLLQVLNGVGGTHIHDFVLDGKYGNISYGLGGTAYSEGLVVERGEIKHMGGDAIRTHKNSTYRHMYCHSFRNWDEAVDGPFNWDGDQAFFPHPDVIQTVRSGNVVEECYFDIGDSSTSTSCCIVKSDADEQIDGFTLRRSYVNGGGIVGYIDNQNSNIDSPGANGQPINIVFEDLIVGRGHREDRVFRHDEVPSTSITINNVVYADTRQPVETVFVDDFNRANEALETRYYDRMSGVASQLTVDTNQVRSVSIAAQGTYLLKTSFGVDLVNHFVEADWKSGTTTGWLICRYADEANYIGMQILAAIPTLYKRVGGTFTQLGAGVTSLTAGDKIRIECRGTQIKLIHKGVLRVTATVSDTILQSGRVGMQSRTTIANPMLDNFIAGSLPA